MHSPLARGTCQTNRHRDVGSADVQFIAWPLSQKQAAARAGMDESTFRRFADLGAILPTPQTRRFGRGKAKSFSQVETVIAFVIEKLMRRGLRATALAEVADWLRSHSGGEYWQAAQRGQPVYLRIMLDPPDGWAGGLRNCATKKRALERARNFGAVPEPTRP